VSLFIVMWICCEHMQRLSILSIVCFVKAIILACMHIHTQTKAIILACMHTHTQTKAILLAASRIKKKLYACRAGEHTFSLQSRAASR
jgi:hypothetical protein